MIHLTQKQIDRFWSKVDIKGPNECWDWNSYKHRQGYGVIKVNSKLLLAHRVSAELAGISIKDKICHSCDNPSCVNPNHLFAGTQKDNINDKINKQRQARGERAGSAKLTELQVIEIRNAIKKLKTSNNRLPHRSRDMLSAKFNISKIQLDHINARTNWKHI